jgi:hypothetical protein
MHRTCNSGVATQGRAGRDRTRDNNNMGHRCPTDAAGRACSPWLARTAVARQPSVFQASGRVSLLLASLNFQARQPARTRQFFVTSIARSGARSRSRKVHQTLLRGGIGRARALREGAVSVAAVAARRHPASPARRQTGNVSGFNDGSCFGVQFDAEPRLACIVVWAPARVELAPPRVSVSRRGISC